MRHTFSTRLVQRNVDLYKVQRLLGHTTGLMTQRYAHHSPESLRDGVRVLEDPRPDKEKPIGRRRSPLASVTIKR
jgi:site-specific recombinase XerD